MSIWSSFGKTWAALPSASAAGPVLKSYFDTLYVALTGNQTVAGIKTFSSNPVVSGGGVQFPATQVPSADVNCLDDYEEGTWTPALAFGGASVGVTYGTRAATYTKVGRFVHAGFDITLTAKGSSTGTATIEGLPFTVTTVTGTASFGFYQNLSGLTGALTGSAGGTSLTLRQHAAASAGTVTDANLTNTTRLVGSITFHT